MIKVGDIIYFHGTCGVVTHISENGGITIYDIVTGDGHVTKEIISESTPKDYSLFKTGKRFELLDMFISICDAYMDDTIKALYEEELGDVCEKK